MPALKWLSYFALALLLVIHTDFWFWTDASLVLGIPVGLLYHIIFCIAASLVMAALVRFAWPKPDKPEMGR